MDSNTHRSRSERLIDRYLPVTKRLNAHHAGSETVLLLDTVDGVDFYESFRPEHWEGEPIAEWDSYSKHPVICGGTLSGKGLSMLRSLLSDAEQNQLDEQLSNRQEDTFLVVGISSDDFHVTRIEKM